MDYLFGDTDGSLVGKQSGSDDVLFASADNMNIVGDANLITGIASGGDDLFIGYYDTSGNNLSQDSVMIGDAVTMTGYSKGGNDYFFASGNLAMYMYGDAFNMEGHSQGGDDTLSISDASLFSSICGDGYSMESGCIGGNDTMAGGTTGSINYLIGDAHIAGEGACGGNDLLYSKRGTDHMWGDFENYNFTSENTPQFGHDVFKFLYNSGQDIVYDFHRGEDKIDLFSKVIKDISEFSMTADAGNLILSFNQSTDSITLIGVDMLDASDFIFFPS